MALAAGGRGAVAVVAGSGAGGVPEWYPDRAQVQRPGPGCYVGTQCQLPRPNPSDSVAFR